MTGMTVIVKTITRLLIGFIAVFAAEVVCYGHLTPGGGFAGGVMFAGAFILIVLALGGDTAVSIIRERSLAVWDSIGALGLLAIALAGFAGGVFFRNILPHGKSFALISGGTVLWSNMAIGIKVAASMAAVFIALTLFHEDDER